MSSFFADKLDNADASTTSGQCAAQRRPERFRAGIPHDGGSAGQLPGQDFCDEALLARGAPRDTLVSVFGRTVRGVNMLTDFVKNDVFFVFRSSPTSGGPASRALGPYHYVQFAAKGIWAWRNDGSEPVRVATQAIDSLCWEVDGFEDPLWGEATIIAPPPGTTARDSEAGTDWIRPQRQQESAP
jgi:hypothetical protein